MATIRCDAGKMASDLLWTSRARRSPRDMPADANAAASRFVRQYWGRDGHRREVVGLVGLCGEFGGFRGLFRVGSPGSLPSSEIYMITYDGSKNYGAWGVRRV